MMNNTAGRLRRSRPGCGKSRPFAEGTIMIMPGDILNAFRRYVQTPVKMTVERGKVVAIEGDGMDATLRVPGR